MKNDKRNRAILILGIVFILTTGGLLVNQMQTNAEANKLIIEKCFESFEKDEEVVITKTDFWSPVVCEKQ